MATLVCNFQTNSRLDLIIAWHVRRCKQPTYITPHEHSGAAHGAAPEARTRAHCSRRTHIIHITLAAAVAAAVLHGPIHNCTPSNMWLCGPVCTQSLYQQLSSPRQAVRALLRAKWANLLVHIPGRFIFSWVCSKGLTYTGRTDGIVGCLILLHIFKRV